MGDADRTTGMLFNGSDALVLWLPLGGSLVSPFNGRRSDALRWEVSVGRRARSPMGGGPALIVAGRLLSNGRCRSGDGYALRSEVPPHVMVPGLMLSNGMCRSGDGHAIRCEVAPMQSDCVGTSMERFSQTALIHTAHLFANTRLEAFRADGMWLRG